MVELISTAEESVTTSLWELDHAENGVVRWDLLEGDVRVAQAAAYLTLGLGIGVWVELLLLVEVLSIWEEMTEAWSSFFSGLVWEPLLNGWKWGSEVDGLPASCPRR